MKKFDFLTIEERNVLLTNVRDQLNKIQGKLENDDSKITIDDINLLYGFLLITIDGIENALNIMEQPNYQNIANRDIPENIFQFSERMRLQLHNILRYFDFPYKIAYLDPLGQQDKKESK